ncbi:MAG: hypothetical protein JXR51_08230 [Bacteroidales bacterium]|nr:hypothetical protein [Bacteroidales bacterium]
MSNTKNKIDTFDIEEYIETMIDNFHNFGSLKKISLCKRFFRSKPNKSFYNSIRILDYLIMEDATVDSIFNELNGELSKNEINECLKILRCNDIVKKDNSKFSYYLADTNNWFSSSQYKIKDQNILQCFSKPLLSFTRVDSSFKPHDFFYSINQLIEFILKKSSLHNPFFELEQKINDAISVLNSIEIKTNNNHILKIEPIQIDIIFNSLKKKDEKILKGFDTISNQEIEIPFSNFDVSNYIQPPKLNTKVSMAVDMSLFKYFSNVDVFDDMEIIYDKNKISQLMEIDLKDFKLNKKNPLNFFVLNVSDDEEFIIQEIQKNIQFIKIISPIYLNDKIKNNLLNFLNELN